MFVVLLFFLQNCKMPEKRGDEDYHDELLHAIRRGDLKKCRTLLLYQLIAKANFIEALENYFPQEGRNISEIVLSFGLK